MLVYRYFNEQYGLLALQQRKWKVGRLLELNDPLDCRPTLTRKQAPQQPRIEDLPYFRDIYESIGIICYSATINDPVVWSHYADSHRGMALGFEFQPDDGMFEVRYPPNDCRPKLDLDALQEYAKANAHEAVLRVISQSFTHKAKSWQYESEYRQFIYLHACEMIGAHYFRTMPLAHLKRIILGVKSRITSSDIVRIMSLWQTRYDVRTTKAEIDSESYQLNV